MDEKGRTQCRELPLCAGSGDFKGWIDPIKLFKSAQTSGNLSLASKLLQFPWYSHTYNYVLAFMYAESITVEDSVLGAQDFYSFVQLLYRSIESMLAPRM